MQLPPVARERLIRLAGMLGSDHDGERSNAAALATKLLKTHGMTWRDVLASEANRSPPPFDTAFHGDARAMARFCTEWLDVLTDWEANFVTSVAKLKKPVSPRQAELVHQITKKIMDACGKGRAA